jgi:hypothetical protein
MFYRMPRSQIFLVPMKQDLVHVAGTDIPSKKTDYSLADLFASEKELRIFFVHGLSWCVPTPIELNGWPAPEPRVCDASPSPRKARRG